jgi:hypothetical protein
MMMAPVPFVVPFCHCQGGEPVAIGLPRPAAEHAHRTARSAYWDFVDYTFWPYANDVFWPYAYDDLYVGVFGPYAYEGPAYAEPAPSSRRARRARQQSAAAAVVCNAQAPALTNWPIQQIADTVKPDQTQQSALNDLKDYREDGPISYSSPSANCYPSFSLQTCHENFDPIYQDASFVSLYRKACRGDPRPPVPHSFGHATNAMRAQRCE